MLRNNKGTTGLHRWNKERKAIYAVDFMKQSDFAHVVPDDEVLSGALRGVRASDPEHKRLADCVATGEHVKKVGDAPKGDVTLLLVRYSQHNTVDEFLSGKASGIDVMACYVIMLFEDSREATRYKLAVCGVPAPWVFRLQRSDGDIGRQMSSPNSTWRAHCEALARAA